jgi:hypothetical protein
MEFDEQHVTAGLNDFSLMGNQRLICLHKIREKKGNHNLFSFPGLNLGNNVVHNLYQ